MKRDCIIFDLDGTLLDSLQGILDACNLTFKQLGMNIHSEYDEAKYFIGAGATVFAKRAMEGKNVNPDQEEKIMSLFLENYGKTQTVSAKPYPEIIEMLQVLKTNGFKLCIASNKPQELLVPIVRKVFPKGLFDVAMGQKKTAPEKPNPFIIYEIERELDVNADRCIYVGDSQYDVDTAINAGLPSIIVTYGYGFYDQEWIKKADYVVDSVKELKEKLLG